MTGSTYLAFAFHNSYCPFAKAVCIQTSVYSLPAQLCRWILGRNQGAGLPALAASSCEGWAGITGRAIRGQRDALTDGEGDGGEGEWCFLPSFRACFTGRRSIGGVTYLKMGKLRHRRIQQTGCSGGLALIPPSCTALQWLSCPVETKIGEKQANTCSPCPAILMLAAVSSQRKA